MALVEKMEIVCECSEFVESSPLWCNRHINETFRLQRAWNGSHNVLRISNMLVLKLWHRARATLEQIRYLDSGAAIRNALWAQKAHK